MGSVSSVKLGVRGDVAVIFSEVTVDVLWVVTVRGCCVLLLLVLPVLVLVLLVLVLLLLLLLVTSFIVVLVTVTLVDGAALVVVKVTPIETLTVVLLSVRSMKNGKCLQTADIELDESICLFRAENSDHS